MGISLLEFEKALIALKEALDVLATTNIDSDNVNYRLARDATIQRYEFSVELSWKTTAKLLGSSSTAAKPVIREMAQNNLIMEVQKWFDFIEGRNKTSHAYDEKIAEEVAKLARQFFPEADQLLEKLKKL